MPYVNPSLSGPQGSLVVRPLRGRADLETFIRLPGRLHRNDPQWIEPLHLERRMHLSNKNPAFEHVTWQGWLAWSGTEPVGRISAQIDALHRERHGADTGHFGMLDAVDDPTVFAALISAAEEWLAQRGTHRITGPFSLTINEESGLLVEGFDTPPMMMMGHAAPYYGPRLEALGYRGAKDLLAYWMRPPDISYTPAMQRMMDRMRDRIRIRQLDQSRFDAELMTLRDIFNDAWAENWGFIPFTEAEFRELGSNLKLLVPPDMIMIAEVDGEPAGFIVGMPNLNEAAAPLHGRLLPFGWLRLLWRLKVRPPRSARVPLMGVRRGKHFSRLGTVLALLLTEAMKFALLRNNMESLEMSWILEDNSGMRNILEHISAKPYKRYRVYEKQL